MEEFKKKVSKEGDEAKRIMLDQLLSKGEMAQKELCDYLHSSNHIKQEQKVRAALTASAVRNVVELFPLFYAQF